MLVIVAFAQPSRGQTARPPGTLALGPLWVTPRVELSNFGIDGNVFNEAVAPREDRVASLTTQLDARLRVRRLTVDGTSSFVYNYFQRFDQERSFNPSQAVRATWTQNRVTLLSSYSVVSTRERPGLEIDLRARRQLTTLSAGVDVRLNSRTHARLEGIQADVNYRSLLFDNVNLREALNRRGREARLSLRHATTTLTTLVLSGEYLEDHFEFTPDRNSIGVRVMPGLEFNRFALISGRASVGWRGFRPESPLVPDYSGPAARVELSTVVGDRLRVDASVDHDVTYSYSAIYPYYLQNLTYVSATLRITRRLDLVLRGGEQRLSYRVLGAESQPSDAPDVLSGTYYGGILGFRLSPAIRLALTGTQARRSGGPLDRPYETWQVGGSIGYGY